MAAWAHIRDLEVKGKAARFRWNAYRCDACGAWHAGHRPGTLAKDIRRALQSSKAANHRNRRRRRR